MSAKVKILMVSIAITLAATLFNFSAVSTPASTKNASYTESAKGYYLKDFNGMLAIFENGKNSPLEILDVELASLPERDIERIKKGIFAEDLNEIFSLAEDYE